VCATTSRSAPGQRALIVSGSNMSGKSTTLRAIGLNVVLALAGAPVRARHMRLTPLAVGGSIPHQRLAARRALAFPGRGAAPQAGHRSRARHAAAALPARRDPARHQLARPPHRLGSGAVPPARPGAIGLVTTHDLALAEMVARARWPISNVHFEDHVEDGAMCFDYQMRPGVVQKSNALALMRAAGLDV